MSDEIYKMYEALADLRAENEWLREELRKFQESYPHTAEKHALSRANEAEAVGRRELAREVLQELAYLTAKHEGDGLGPRRAVVEIESWLRGIAGEEA